MYPPSSSALEKGRRVGFNLNIASHRPVIELEKIEAADIFFVPDSWAVVEYKR